MKRIDEIPQIRIMPDLNVIKIGGHGTIDYGRDVVFPIVEEIGALKEAGEKILLVTGGEGASGISWTSGSTRGCRPGSLPNSPPRSASRTRS
ncbi:MAG: hypothetical protein PHP59_07405 [Methanofollis sp.]|jgi:molybdenum storage protein|uniref:hypothetical protein n=1 Tax=Methanofollis sp. TaxID=2052835 RepID=UPI00260E54CE|nr:hypothetical protein [Methanofollis sp.]MDD4255188.1 hypothetical protein [Methanofollis sp.]